MYTLYSNGNVVNFGEIIFTGCTVGSQICAVQPATKLYVSVFIMLAYTGSIHFAIHHIGPLQNFANDILSCILHLKKMVVFVFKFHWSLFPRDQLSTTCIVNKVTTTCVWSLRSIRQTYLASKRRHQANISPVRMQTQIASKERAFVSFGAWRYFWSEMIILMKN